MEKEPLPTAVDFARPEATPEVLGTLPHDTPAYAHAAGYVALQPPEKLPERAAPGEGGLPEPEYRANPAHGPAVEPAAPDAPAGSDTYEDRQFHNSIVARANEAIAPHLQAALQGDTEAVTQVVAAASPAILSYCKARLPDHAAQDAAQETYLAMFEALKDGRVVNRHKPFMAYAYAIAGHKVTDVHRSRRKQESHAYLTDSLPDIPDNTTLTPEEHAAAYADRPVTQALRTILSKLSERQRHILYHREIVGHTTVETARLLDTSPGAVRVNHHRALQRLRAQAVRHPSLSRQDQ